MNLTELYSATAVEQHGNIRVNGDRVVVRSAQGTDEYVIDSDGELFLLSTDTDIRADLAAIKEKLGI